MPEQVEKLTIKVAAKDETSGVFETVERRVKELKQRYGRRGLAADIAEIAMGGGAIAGLGVVTEAAGSLLEHVTEVMQKLDEGKESGVEIAAAFAKSLPIVGHLASGMEKFLGYATGATQAMEKLREQTEAADKHTAEMVAHAIAFMDAAKATEGLRLFNDSWPSRGPGAAAGEPIAAVVRENLGAIMKSSAEFGAHFKEATGTTALFNPGNRIMAPGLDGKGNAVPVRGLVDLLEDAKVQKAGMAARPNVWSWLSSFSASKIVGGTQEGWEDVKREQQAWDKKSNELDLKIAGITKAIGDARVLIADQSKEVGKAFVGMATGIVDAVGDKDFWRTFITRGGVPGTGVLAVLNAVLVGKPLADRAWSNRQDEQESQNLLNAEERKRGAALAVLPALQDNLRASIEDVGAVNRGQYGIGNQTSIGVRGYGPAALASGDADYRQKLVTKIDEMKKAAQDQSQEAVLQRKATEELTKLLGGLLTNLQIKGILER